MTIGRVEKMSKSKKNVVDPGALVERYGADTTRLFCLFAAPPEKDLEWSEQGVEGGFRFLNRLWRLSADWMPQLQGISPYAGGLEGLEEPLRGLVRKTHETIRKVTRDIEDRFHFNTAISAVMELVNTWSAIEPGKDSSPVCRSVVRLALETVVLLLAPIVPHIAEEIWQALGHEKSLLRCRWPSFREDAIERETALVVLQVNGKLRSRMEVPVGLSEEELRERALADETVQKFIAGKPVRKVVVVGQKLVNVVV